LFAVSLLAGLTLGSSVCHTSNDHHKVFDDNRTNGMHISEEPAAKLCVGCDAVRYCSQECQNSDWSSHKLLCKDIEAFGSEHRPSSSHLRAILFHDDATKPELIWIKFTSSRISLHDFDPQIVRPMEIEVDAICVTAKELQDKMTPMLWCEYAAKQTKTNLGTPIHRKIKIWIREGFLFDSSATNGAFLAATNSYGDMKARLWKGPIVAPGMEGQNKDAMKYVDADLDHYRTIIEKTVWYKHICSDGEVDMHFKKDGRKVSLEEVMSEVKNHPKYARFREILGREDELWKTDLLNAMGI
jgi:hypothetical protein